MDHAEVDNDGRWASEDGRRRATRRRRIQRRKQLREQQDVAAVLQAHTRVIMREVCKWTRGYIEIRLSDFALPPLAARDAEPKQVEAASDET